jgi:hypothetical protein
VSCGICELQVRGKRLIRHELLGTAQKAFCFFAWITIKVARRVLRVEHDGEYEIIYETARRRKYLHLKGRKEILYQVNMKMFNFQPPRSVWFISFAFGVNKKKRMQMNCFDGIKKKEIEFYDRSICIFAQENDLKLLFHIYKYFLFYPRSMFFSD